MRINCEGENDMKKQIRRGVYETNSSSCHSITMCTEADYYRWENGELLLCMGWGFGYPKDNKPGENHFYTRDEAIAFEKTSRFNSDVDWNNKHDVDIILRDNGFLTYDYFWNVYCEECYEGYEETMVTPSGDSIVAFGYYGS